MVCPSTAAEILTGFRDVAARWNQDRWKEATRDWLILLALAGLAYFQLQAGSRYIDLFATDPNAKSDD